MVLSLWHTCDRPCPANPIFEKAAQPRDHAAAPEAPGADEEEEAEAAAAPKADEEEAPEPDAEETPNTENRKPGIAEELAFFPVWFVMNVLDLAVKAEEAATAKVGTLAGETRRHLPLTTFADAATTFGVKGAGAPKPKAHGGGDEAQNSTDGGGKVQSGGGPIDRLRTILARLDEIDNLDFKWITKISTLLLVMGGVHLYYAYMMDSTLRTLYPEQLQDILSVFTWMSENNDWLEENAPDALMDVVGNCTMFAGPIQDLIWQKNSAFIFTPITAIEGVGIFLDPRSWWGCLGALGFIKNQREQLLVDELKKQERIALHRMQESNIGWEGGSQLAIAPVASPSFFPTAIGKQFAIVYNYAVGGYKGVPMELLHLRNQLSIAQQQLANALTDAQGSSSRVADQMSVATAIILQAGGYFAHWAWIEMFIFITMVLPNIFYYLKEAHGKGGGQGVFNRLSLLLLIIICLLPSVEENQGDPENGFWNIYFPPLPDGDNERLQLGRGGDGSALVGGRYTRRHPRVKRNTKNNRQQRRSTKRRRRRKRRSRRMY